MTISGAGSGSNFPQNPSIWETQTSGAVEAARSLMKMVPDTIEIPLMLMDYDTRKYQATASRPMMPPLVKSRTLNEPAALPDLTQSAIYQKLVNDLPADIKTLLQLNLKLPPDKQNANFIALNNLLQSAASGIAFLDRASLPIVPDSLEADRAQANVLMPYIALSTLAGDAALLASAANSTLTSLGANYINFDLYSNAVGQFSGIANDLQTLISLLQDPGKAAQASDLLSSISADAERLGSELAPMKGAGEFNFLFAALAAIGMTVSALSMSQPGVASLALGIDIALLGFDAGENALGAAGPAFNATAGAAAAFVNGAFLSGAPAGPQTMLENLLVLALSCAIILGGQAAENAGNLPVQISSADAEAAAKFGFELTLILWTSAGMVDGLSNGLSGMLGASPENQAFISSVFGSCILLGLILGGTAGSGQNGAERFVASFASLIAAGFASAAEYVNSQGIDGNSVEGSGREPGVYLNQAADALQNGDYETFFSALDNICRLAGTDLGNLFADASAVAEQGASLVGNLDTSGNENLTGITTAA